MKKGFKQFLRTHWILTWIILLVILLTSTISFGAYTYLKYAKRVISMQSTSGIPFSSNLLSSVQEKETEYSTTLFSYSGTSMTRLITVCNYPQNSPTDINKDDIDYKLSAKIIDKDNKLEENYNGFKISFNGKDYFFNNNGKIEISDIEMKSTSIACTHNFILYTSSDYLKYIDIEIVAEPSNYTYTENIKLARIFSFTNVQDSVQKWSGTFADKFSMEGVLGVEADSKNYKGFNYEISGNGKGIFTFSWNTDYVEVDTEFLKDKNVNQNLGSTIKSFTIRVGDNDISSYRFQLYRTKAAANNEEYKNYNEEYKTLFDGNMPYVTYEFENINDLTDNS